MWSALTLMTIFIPGFHSTIDHQSPLLTIDPFQRCSEMVTWEFSTFRRKDILAILQSSRKLQTNGEAKLIASP
jgi:hypothetical protein